MLQNYLMYSWLSVFPLIVPEGKGLDCSMKTVCAIHDLSIYIGEHVR